MKKKTFIFGAGSLAELAFHYAQNEMGLDIFAFVVDQHFYLENSKINCKEVMPRSVFEKNFSSDSVEIFVAIGYRSMFQRQQIFCELRLAGYSFFNIISKNVYVADGVKLGENNIIMPGTVIEPKVSVGHNNVFWSNVTVCHESTIGDHNFFAANSTVGGSTSIGSKNFFGFSSVVVQKTKVKDQTIIGASSLVLHDPIPNAIHFGAPISTTKAIPQFESYEIC